MIVVATTESDLTAMLHELGRRGAERTEVLSPGGSRRLVLVETADPWTAQRLVESLRAEGVVAVVRPDDGPALDAWRHDTQPVTFCDRLAVCLAWSEHDRRGLPPTIELGTGGFGNGHHPTTRMLIDELAARIRGGERVLDVGCGSGVLSLCALRFGADIAVAVDLKPAAVEATRINAALNGLDARVVATTATLDEIDGSFDIVLANIGRSAIVELAPQLVRLTAPSGWLAVSGISPSQCSQVAEFLTPLAEVDRRTSDDWSVVVLAHPDVCREFSPPTGPVHPHVA